MCRIRTGYWALIFVIGLYLLPTSPCQPYHEEINVGMVGTGGQHSAQAGGEEPDLTASSREAATVTEKEGHLLSRKRKKAPNSPSEEYSHAGVFCHC